MSTELTTAALLLTLALLCAGWLTRSHPVAPRADAGPDADEWRSTALQYFQEHRDLQRTVAEVLATPGAVNGPARTELFVALGADRFDRYA